MLSDDELTRQANFAAVSLIREAIEHSQEPGGDAMKTLTPYFHSLWEAQGSPQEGVNVTGAIAKVMVCLSQMAGVLIEAGVAQRVGRKPTIPELLARLDVIEMDLLGGPGGHLSWLDPDLQPGARHAHPAARVLLPPH